MEVKNTAENAQSSGAEIAPVPEASASGSTPNEAAATANPAGRQEPEPELPPTPDIDPAILKRLREIEDTYDTLMGQLREQKNELVKQVKDTEEAKERGHKQNAQLEEIKTAREKELKEVKGKSDRQENQLSHQSSELELLKSLFPIVNSVSSAKLTEMIEKLNNDISSFASFVVDPTCKTHEKRVSKTSDTVRQSQDELFDRHIVNTDILRGFEDDRFANSPKVFTNVLRSCLSHVCKWIISSVSYSMDKSFEKVIEEVEKSEPYPKFAHWRAIVHRQASKRDEIRWEKRAEQFITHVLNISGYHLSSAEILIALEDKIHQVVGEALKINRAVMQEALWTQVEVLLFNTNTTFDPLKMKTTPVPGPDQTPRIVLSTGLGLSLREAKCEKGEHSFGPWETVVKVAIELPGAT